MHDTKIKLLNTSFPQLSRRQLDTLQVNLGYICNQSCKHCHVNASPKRTETMALEDIDDILSFIKNNNIKKLDLTGGAPELNQHFRYLITEARALNVSVIDRCNLTVLSEPEQEGLAEFLANNQVEVVASLPCYSKDNVDLQRGNGVFDLSITALQKLNSLGYAAKDNGLVLNLMYNPTGAFLPPAQKSLEDEYRQKLREDFNIEFSNLYTLTNMPIMRFGSTLISKGEFENYMALLKNAHSDDNLQTVMCRNLISIDWQGFIYDCDFNQMLDMPSNFSPYNKTHISELNLNNLQLTPIQIGDHCYGCTAGSGSSCGGALS
ncbi:MAG: radical SAM protein [endosymbiont of Galathealinum brachiosum]|uniref:Radical SAM protein n=1 Tax=endosymbiont of Galathealinum brachiosum TaxID=2200906 RepID=A0A370DDP1_9GAMM|nr:MAG: radical SAM protein [endosymbiont of Galathealinum brachiosum]